MKNFSKKIISLMLIMMMVVSGVSFAGTTTGDMEKLMRDSLSTDSQKISNNLSQLDVAEDEDVRVIVELNENPIISYATERGVKLSELGDSYTSKLSTKIENEQNAVIDAIESKDVEIDVLNRFENVFNGFSINVKYGEVDKIADLPNVKKVYIANRYERPEPQMSNSYMLTKSRYVNEDLGMTGKGIIVSIIDSGIDPTHKDFKIDNGTVVALTESSVAKIVDEKELPGKFYTNKVPYGYNYMDKNEEIRDLGVDANMHGMHVGGTVGANGELKGVAPNVQLLAMKVFGNDPEMPSTFGDIIVKAIDDSIALGADVMNLSLGSSAAFVDAEDPEQVAVARAVEAGIIMSISAGNSAFYGNGYADPYATNPDVGVVGSPGISTDSLQVASVENYSVLNISSVKCAGTDMEILGFGKDQWEDKKYKLVSIGGSKLGKPEDFAGMDLKDKVVLVSRGSLSFFDKTENASKAGAKAIIVYNNNITSHFYKDQGGWSIPFMKIQVDEGKELERILADNGGEIEITVKNEEQYVNPSTGELSSFSSWGVTPSLDFKPEISAPGGNIYSTLNNDHYGYMSGTSMAAPHVAGGSALVVERVNTASEFKGFVTKNKDKAELVKNILMNTAKPVVDYTLTDDLGKVIGESYTSVRRQGAGAMDLKAAMETMVVVTEKNSGIAKVSLGEIGDQIEFDLVAKNYGSQDLVCSIDAMAQTNEEKDGANLLTSELLKNVATKITVNGNPVGDKVTIPGNAQIDIHVTMDFSKVSADIMKKFPNGNFIEGFVFLRPYNEEALSALDSLTIDSETAKKNVDDKKKELVLAEVAITDQKAVVKKLEDEKASLNVKLEELESTYSEVIAKNQAANEALGSYENALVAYNKLVDENGTIDIDSAKEALESMKAAVKGLSDEIAKLNSDLASAELELSQMNGNGTVSGPVTSIVDNTAKESLEAKIAELKEQLAAKNSMLDKENAKLEKQILVVEEAEKISKIIETAKAAMESAKASYDKAYSTLSDVDKALINEYVSLRSQAQARLASIEAELVAENSKLNNLKAKFDTLSAELISLETILAEKLNGLNNAGYDYKNVLPLSVPFLGFYGNWGDAPAFDSPLYDKKNSFYGLTGLYNVSKSGEDFIGQDIEGNIAGEHVSISPNGDDTLDSALPIISVHRNVKNVEFNILDENKKLLRTIGKSESYRKTFYDAGEDKRYYYLPKMAWDGTVNMEVVPDGKYFYQIKGVLADDENTVKELNLPIVVDTTAPSIASFDYNNGGDMFKVNASDNGVGIKAYFLFELVNDDVKLIKSNTTGEFKINELTKMPKVVNFAVADFAGNMSFGKNPVAINDTLAPDVKLTNVEAFGVINTKEFTLKGTAQEFVDPTIVVDGEKVEVTFNKETGLYEFEKEFKFETDGKKGINVLASDYMGNKVEFIRHFYIDSTPVDLEVKPSIELKEGVINSVKSDVKTVKFDIKAVESTFPDLELRFNQDVIYKVEKDYVAYSDLIEGTEYTTSKEITLKDGLNNVLIEAVDTAGNLTKVEYKIMKLGEGQNAPTFTKEEFVINDNGVSTLRPFEVSMATETDSDWTMIILDPNGKEVFDTTAVGTKEFSKSWNPEEENKLNGVYTCKIEATSGGITLATVKEFKVYNFEFKINTVSRVDRGQMLNIVAEVENLDGVEHEPIVVVQIRKEDGSVISIGTAQSTVDGGKTAKLSSGIVMPEAGKYTAEVYVWTAFDDGRVLCDSPRLGDGIIEFTVKE